MMDECGEGSNLVCSLCVCVCGEAKKLAARLVGRQHVILIISTGEVTSIACAGASPCSFITPEIIPRQIHRKTLLKCVSVSKCKKINKYTTHTQIFYERRNLPGGDEITSSSYKFSTREAILAKFVTQCKVTGTGSMNFGSPTRVPERSRLVILSPLPLHEPSVGLDASQPPGHLGSLLNSNSRLQLFPPGLNRTVKGSPSLAVQMGSMQKAFPLGPPLE